MNVKAMYKKYEIIKALFEAAVIWEWQQSYAYLYATMSGIFFSFIFFCLYPNISIFKKGEYAQAFYQT